MNKAKEELIDLVEQFCALGDEAMGAADDENELNDRMNAVAIKLEEASIPVFGEKINMDFGMINTIFLGKDEVIQYIRDYEIEQ